MSESRQISEKIDEIISARKTRKSLLDKRIRDLDASIAAVELLESLRNRVISEDGTLLPNSPYYDLFADNVKRLGIIGSISTSPFLKDAKTLRDGYAALNCRFQRNFINIAVVGPARQGKSRLLQSISGLDSRCIPAFDGDHCTGASSTIENGANDHVRVCITYKTKDDILKEVQDYLDIISNKTEHIYSVEELPKFTLERLNGMLERVTEKKADATAKKNTLYRRYVEHYSEWCYLIGREPEWKEDEDEIMTYVAQHNGLEEDSPDFRRYFKFVGVKMAQIIKGFRYHDSGKIKMVDTVGLGDTSTDTNSKMLETIKTDSDAVIFFKFPEPKKGGTFLQEELEVFDQIRQQFELKNMAKWFAFLFNHSKDDPARGRVDNLSRCKSYKNDMDRPGISLQ